MGGPEDGARLAVRDETSRVVFAVVLAPPLDFTTEGVDAPVPVWEHRYDYDGWRLRDGTYVFVYRGLHPSPGGHARSLA